MLQGHSAEAVRSDQTGKIAFSSSTLSSAELTLEIRGLWSAQSQVWMPQFPCSKCKFRHGFCRKLKLMDCSLNRGVLGTKTSEKSQNTKIFLELHFFCVYTEMLSYGRTRSYGLFQPCDSLILFRRAEVYLKPDPPEGQVTKELQVLSKTGPSNPR